MANILLVSLIERLEKEQSLTIFCQWQINTYIYANVFQKSVESRFVVKVD